MPSVSTNNNKNVYVKQLLWVAGAIGIAISSAVFLDTFDRAYTRECFNAIHRELDTRFDHVLKDLEALNKKLDRIQEKL